MDKKLDTLAKRIEFLRLEKKLSKTDVWDGVGLTSGVYAQWMNGQNLKADTLVKLANLFGVNYEWLLNGKGDKYNDAKKEDTEYVAKPSTIVAGIKIDSTEMHLLKHYRLLSSVSQSILDLTLNRLYELEYPEDGIASGKRTKVKETK